ncbi:MAG: phage tail sheath subtilisin-like domain-containing protein [Pseudomonadota bacterium]
MTGFLHGIETIENTDGLRPIQGVRSSVIGLIGTAPNADNDKFPLDTPVLVAGRRADAAGLGTGGTLADGVDAIFDQIGALIVVVRVEDDATPANVFANLIGGVDGVSGDHTGVHCFKQAEALTGFAPKILVAPGYGNQTSVITEMISIADTLRACIIAEGPSTNDTDATTYRGNFGSDRVFVVDPKVKVFNPSTASNVNAPVSARVAGVIARTDHERGFWWSPSNQVVNGVIGTMRPIEHSLTDYTAQSQILNENEVATIVRQDGWRLFGNRTCSTDPQWAFLSVRRTADMIYESIERGHAWALDRPFSAQLLRDIVDGVNAYLRSLVARGALLGGRAILNPELNSEAALKAGQLYIDFDIEPPAPLERLTFTAYRNGDYYETLVESALSS